MNTQIFCDECKHEFLPRVKEKRTKDGGAKQWFTCPACKHKYGVAKITRRGLELRQRLGKLKPEQIQERARLQEEMKGEVSR